MLPNSREPDQQAVPALSGFDPARVSQQGIKHLGGEIYLRWVARKVPLKVCEGGGWYSLHPTERVWVVRHAAAHKRDFAALWFHVPKCEWDHFGTLEEQLARAEADIRHRFKQAIAAATGTAKTPRGAECEASQSGPQGIAQTPSHDPS